MANAGELKAGFSRVDITPPLGAYMPGYYESRYAKSVLDPLEINCLALSDGVRTALVLQIDTEEITDRVADGMRAAIVKATNVDRDAIILHASHTHDGGCLIRRGPGDCTPEDEGDCAPTELDYLYVKMVTSRAADAAMFAMADLKPARLSAGRSVASRISFGRRYLMKDGKVRTNPGTNNPDIVRPVGNPPDEEMQLLRIDRDGGKPIAVINFQTHPDVIGGETISADWPGLTRTVFEAATLGEASCMVLNGTEGDVNHCNLMPRPGEANGLKRGFDGSDRGYEHAKHMANVLAGAALSVWQKCAPLEAGPIRYGVETVRVPAQKAKDSDEKNLAWAERVHALHAAGKDAELPWKDMELTTEVARACRIRRLAKGPDAFDLPLTTLAVGDAVAFAGFPGEPFNDIGKRVKKGSPFKMTLLSCLSNGARGYFPFSDSYKEDGYEVATSPFGPSVADDLIAGELRLLKRLNGPVPEVLTEFVKSEAHPRNSEGDVVKLRDGRLLVVYSHFYKDATSQYAGGAHDHSSAELVVTASADGGKTWSPIRTVVRKPVGSLNVMSASFLRLGDGRLALFYLLKQSETVCVPTMVVSSDEGETWSAPTCCVPESAVAYYVMNNARAVRLANGRLVLPLAHHDIRRTQEGKFKETLPSHVLCALSDDGGKTWRMSADCRAAKPEKEVYLQEPGLIELKDGRLMMYARSNERRQWRLYSTDGGDHWSEPEPVTEYATTTVSPVTYTRLSTGQLALVFNDASLHPKDEEVVVYERRWPYSLAVSSDEGRTWKKKLLEPDSAEWNFLLNCCYCAMREIDGRLVLVYCHRDWLATTRVMSVPLAWLPR